MKKICAFIFVFFFFVNTAGAQCSYRIQKKMLKNHRSVKKKVINAQIKGKLQAIQELSAQEPCNSAETKKKILLYQQQIEKLTNEKSCIKQEYKTSLRALKASD